MSDTEISLPPVTFHRTLDQAALAGIVPWWRSGFGVTGDQPKGAGSLIGIVDTGVDEAHVTVGCLKGAILKAIDFTGSPSQWRDKAGHGTHVAGIALGLFPSRWGNSPAAGEFPQRVSQRIPQPLGKYVAEELMPSHLSICPLCVSRAHIQGTS